MVIKVATNNHSSAIVLKNSFWQLENHSFKNMTP
jgi:hypothetical protein